MSKQLPSGHHAVSHTFHDYVENIGKVSKRDPYFLAIKILWKPFMPYHTFEGYFTMVLSPSIDACTLERDRNMMGLKGKDMM